MKHRNIIDRELRLMVSDGLRRTRRMCRPYEQTETELFPAIERACLRHYALKVKRSQIMRLAAFVGGISLNELVNQVFEEARK